MALGFRWSQPDVRVGDLASLARTPILVEEIVLDRPAEWLDSRHIPDGLSPREVLGHFIDGEQVDWMPRVRQILESGEDRPFRPFDVQGGNGMSHSLEVPHLVKEFAHLRRANLAALAQLRITDHDLGKTGVHPRFGRVTLDQLLSTWVAHDLYHLGQIFKSFSTQFRESIGPWQELLNLPQFN